MLQRKTNIFDCTIVANKLAALPDNKMHNCATLRCRIDKSITYFPIKVYLNYKHQTFNALKTPV